MKLKRRLGLVKICRGSSLLIRHRHDASDEAKRSATRSQEARRWRERRWRCPLTRPLMPFCSASAWMFLAISEAVPVWEAYSTTSSLAGGALGAARCASSRARMAAPPVAGAGPAGAAGVAVAAASAGAGAAAGAAAAAAAAAVVAGGTAPARCARSLARMAAPPAACGGAAA